MQIGNKLLAWFGIEIILFSSYMITMLVLLVKSRWVKVGINQED